MGEYNAKNYTEQGGEVTHIGGLLEFDDGAAISGFPGAKNQDLSTATQVAGLRADFNTLLNSLKEAGVMIPNFWDITVGLAPTPTDQVVAANNGKVSTAFDGETIIITADVDKLTESASSVPEQGTHKWICLDIGTGLAAITDCKYNGSQLTEQDVADATACGCEAGSFVLYIKTEVVAQEGKTFTLMSDGYQEKEINIVVIEP